MVIYYNARHEVPRAALELVGLYCRPHDII